MNQCSNHNQRNFPSLENTISLKLLKLTLVRWESQLTSIQQISTSHNSQVTNTNTNTNHTESALNQFFQSLQIPVDLNNIIMDSLASGQLVWDYYNESNANLLSELSNVLSANPNPDPNWTLFRHNLSQPEWTNEFKIFWELIINKIEFLYKLTNRAPKNVDLDSRPNARRSGEFQSLMQSNDPLSLQHRSTANYFRNTGSPIFTPHSESSHSSYWNKQTCKGQSQISNPSKSGWASQNQSQNLSQNPRSKHDDSQEDSRQFESISSKFISNSNAPTGLFTVKEVCPSKSQQLRDLKRVMSSQLKLKQICVSKSQQLRNIRRAISDKSLGIDKQVTHSQGRNPTNSKPPTPKSCKWSEIKRQILQKMKITNNPNIENQNERVLERCKSAKRTSTRNQNLKRNNSYYLGSRQSHNHQKSSSRKPKIKKKVLSRRRIDFEDSRIQNPNPKKRENMARQSLKRKLDYVLERDAMAYANLEMTGFKDRDVLREWTRLNTEEKVIRQTLSKSKADRLSDQRSQANSRTSHSRASHRGTMNSKPRSHARITSEPKNSTRSAVHKSGTAQISILNRHNSRQSQNSQNRLRSENRLKHPHSVSRSHKSNSQSYNLSRAGSAFSQNQQISTRNRLPFRLNHMNSSKHGSVLASQPTHSEKRFRQSLHLGGRGLVKSQSSRQITDRNRAHSTRSGAKTTYHSQYLLKKSLSLERGVRCGPNQWLKRPKDPLQTLNSDGSGSRVQKVLKHGKEPHSHRIKRISSGKFNLDYLIHGQVL